MSQGGWGGLLSFNIDDACEIVFREYAEKLYKWSLVAHLGKSKPRLGSVTSSVSKRFATHGTPGSLFSPKELTEYYVAYRLNDYKGLPNETSRSIYVKSFGIDTLGGSVAEIVRGFIVSGARVERAP